ncbi:hypothetical protein DJ531_08210 [Sulfolobus sp. A20-N-F6]|uniref:hypothetical protein n=1 Tax=Sulfolobaceae TaxID=118883 RepID=UPI000845F299|nr:MULTISPECIES: hypothetical protein [unclassified Sulfolobus]TRM74684.1 hypothetical protein DJ528_10135 [Sulfolobus sp. B5]TRM78301.1 hypothetical protein DJ532_01820 [Sulfolobus sp. A20-N-F8]TRM81711.1 hypothetical protein DJ524_03060 [Sulfolobus sp. D5]TRM82814.1 hypothetical protein DJ531_08210 [Sulfolobus sp. A20-N-F6]TRM88068.1 hypothetical protein DJ529_06395 [Sulfolobus sp. C3]TRM91305.1 hypothetical protein DJ526_06865 [Sulfolobus sp. A20-N-G8]TRM99685.1 hypothetical protein DJ530
MKIKNVSITTDSPKIYREFLSELKKRNVKLSEKGEVNITVNNVRTKEDFLKALGKIIALSRGKEEFNELLIGIDTNSSYLSIAVILDGEVIECHKAPNISSLIKLLSEVLLIYPARRKIIGVGVGNSYGRDVYEILCKIFDNVKYVDEKHTNLKTHFNQLSDRDLRAAYSIALRASS